MALHANAAVTTARERKMCFYFTLHNVISPSHTQHNNQNSKRQHKTDSKADNESNKDKQRNVTSLSTNWRTSSGAAVMSSIM